MATHIGSYHYIPEYLNSPYQSLAVPYTYTIYNRLRSGSVRLSFRSDRWFQFRLSVCVDRLDSDATKGIVLVCEVAAHINVMNRKSRLV